MSDILCLSCYCIGIVRVVIKGIEFVLFMRLIFILCGNVIVVEGDSCDVGWNRDVSYVISDNGWDVVVRGFVDGDGE